MSVAEDLYEYGQVNYNKEGWDFIVECWTVKEIEAELNRLNIINLNDAINHFGEIYGIINEEREGVQSLEV